MVMADRDIQRVTTMPADATPGHTCEPPDAATATSRKWFCPVCDAEWWRLGRMLGRKLTHEWRLVTRPHPLEHPRRDGAMVSELAARELWIAMGGEPHYSPAYTELLERARSLVATQRTEGIGT